ncbi:hypothetical protein [Mongoliitalea daihaiensis]|nr:hypothetical protein [Mongoliitalea daihaiensis]
MKVITLPVFYVDQVSALHVINVGKAFKDLAMDQEFDHVLES